MPAQVVLRSVTTPRVPILNIFSPILADTIDQHMPNVARPRGLPGMNPGHPSVLFAEVVTQMGIEPVTTRCLVVVLTTKLLGLGGALNVKAGVL